MVELADALASGASDRKIVRVQVPPSAPTLHNTLLELVLRATLVRKDSRRVLLRFKNGVEQVLDELKLICGTRRTRGIVNALSFVLVCIEKNVLLMYNHDRRK